MNLFEALKQKRNLRRPIPSHLGSNGDGWLGREQVVSHLTGGYTLFTTSSLIQEVDLLAEDWEVQETAVERLQRRITNIHMTTGIHPEVLDVPEKELEELEDAAKYSAWSWGRMTLEFYAPSGGVRLVKARK